MASEMETSENMTQSKTITIQPRIDRKLQKKLQNCGLEYVSRSGKIIPAKKQPDVLCQCPQRCGEKIPQDVRRFLFTEFYKLGDHTLQNELLMSHIETRAVQRRSTDHKISPVRNQRRVSCKYHVPLLTSGPLLGSSTKNSEEKKRVEVCQKAFMNVYAITEKRVRLQREKLISQHGIAPLRRHVFPPNTVRRQTQEGVSDLRADEPIDLRKREPPSMIPIPLMMKAPDNDIAIVHNFFQNQLWKPEYIGTAT